MLDNLPENNVLYSFILEKIKINYKFNAKVQDNELLPYENINWLDIDPYNLSKIEGGTYLFHQKLTGLYYIGSASCFMDRVFQHLDQFRGIMPKSLHKLEKSRQSTLTFSIIHITPNLFKLFRKSYPNYILTQGEYDILSALTLYPNRILEQDLINKFKPTINGRGIYDTTVYHKYTSWDPSNLNKKMINLQGSIPVNIYDEKGSLEYVANSYNDARKFLGMSYSSVPLYLNNSKPFYSKLLNNNFFLRTFDISPDKSQIDISKENFAVDLKKIEHKLKNTEVLTLKSLNLNDLSLLFLYCFNENKETFTTFFTITELYKTLFPKKSEEILKNNKTFTGPYSIIRNRINLESPVLGEDGKLYFIAKNPNRIDSEFRENSVVWLIDTQLLEAKLFPNLNLVTEYVKAHNITLRQLQYHKNTGKVYKGFMVYNHIEFINLIKPFYWEDGSFKPGIYKLKFTNEQLEKLIK